jgi:hypothetical protein
MPSFSKKFPASLPSRASQMHAKAVAGARASATHAKVVASSNTALAYTPRQWRAARIQRFTQKQQQTREWINFAEIADWCSKEDHSIIPNEVKRAAAFDTLARDLLSGAFEGNGRSRVLYLSPAIPKARMTRAWLDDATHHSYDNNGGRSEYLPYCWIPRQLFKRWLARNRLQESPSLFEPPVAPTPLKKQKRGRPQEYNWNGVKSRLTDYASQHGPMQTLEELLQKCADFAAELHPRHHTPSDKTIREAIKRHQLETAARLRQKPAP